MKPEHLQRCQVATPHDVVSLVWDLANSARSGSPFDAVLDLGAGDARFARDARASFKRYLGIERDQAKIRTDQLPTGAVVRCDDAMRLRVGQFDLAIGNPPYIRHHHLDPVWRAETVDLLHRESGIRLKRTANLFVLFILQALLRTHERGLVVQLVPYEWVTRPSALELRQYIQSKGWGVKVYRFNADIFPTVLTTASLVLIDKSVADGTWEFGEIGRDGAIRASKSASGNANAVLAYSQRSEYAHALRGLSPGGQDIFVLTEQERLHYSLRKRRDVVPCITSLRHLPAAVTRLDADSFAREFVATGARCWLIRSDRDNRSPELGRYLLSVGTRWKQYSTCTIRQDWAKYRPHPAPALLASSGFVGKAPKVVSNDVGAIAVGSVYGILSKLTGRRLHRLAQQLRAYDFESRLVHHANNLKKIEVRQLNAVLEELATQGK